MARKKRKPDDINTNAWMDTYADTITLLLTFFILLYSMSSTDNEKLKVIAAALKGEITGIPTKLEDTPDALEGVLEQGIGLKNPYDALVEQVQDIINESGLTESIKIREEDTGVVLQLSESILFDTGRADLKPESTKVLDIISKLIPSIQNDIMVQGHTDNVPINSSTYKSNWEYQQSLKIHQML